MGIWSRNATRETGPKCRTNATFGDCNAWKVTREEAEKRRFTQRDRLLYLIIYIGVRPGCIVRARR